MSVWHQVSVEVVGQSSGMKTMQYYLQASGLKDKFAQIWFDET